MSSRVKQLQALPLWNALSTMLPTESQSWLLRACLGDGEDVAEAWKIWTRQVESPIDGLHNPTHGGRWLLSELYSALQPLSASMDDRVMFVVRAARAAEEIRAAAHARVLGDAFLALTRAGVVPIVMRGAALQETVYPPGRIRHGHGIDFLIEERCVIQAMAVLENVGLLLSNDCGCGDGSVVRLEHPSGSFVNLWCTLFACPSQSPPSADILRRSVFHDIAGHRIPTLCPADALLSVLGWAGDSASRETLLWVSDAYHILSSCPDLNWSTFTGEVISCGKSLPIVILMGYLVDALRLDVPDEVFDRLIRRAAAPSRLEQDLALHAARRGANGGLRNLVRRSRSNGEQWIALRSLLCPSWSFARRVNGEASPVRIAMRYLSEPLGAARRRFLKRRARNGVRVQEDMRGGG